MTLPDDLRRQVHRDARASLRTLGLLEAAADEIERLQRPDGREAPVWSALIRAMFLRTGWKSCDLSEHYCGDPEETSHAFSDLGSHGELSEWSVERYHL